MDQINQVPNPAAYQQKPPLPNSVAVLVLGIVSIALCWCWGIISIATGIVGIILSMKAVELNKQSPGVYSESSYKNVNAGKICSIIGISLGALYLIFSIIYVIIVGAAFGGLNFWKYL